MVKTVPFIERRRFPRHPTSSKACTVSGNWWEHPSLTRLALRDVSTGGLSAASDVALPVAETVTVMLPADEKPGYLTRSCTGRVVRCRHLGAGYQVAVAFDQPPITAG